MSADGVLEGSNRLPRLGVFVDWFSEGVGALAAHPNKNKKTNKNVSRAICRVYYGGDLIPAHTCYHVVNQRRVGGER